MWRWTRRILVGVVSLVVAASLCGASYQAWATKRDLAAHSPPGKWSTSEVSAAPVVQGIRRSDSHPRFRARRSRV